METKAKIDKINKYKIDVVLAAHFAKYVHLPYHYNFKNYLQIIGNWEFWYNNFPLTTNIERQYFHRKVLQYSNLGYGTMLYLNVIEDEK